MRGKEKHIEAIREAFLCLSESALKSGSDLRSLKEIVYSENCVPFKKRRFLYSRKILLIALVLPIFFTTIVKSAIIDFTLKFARGTRCIIPNNYFVWEFTRPVSDCDYCRGVESALILKNVTRREFEIFAYSSRPIIVKNAAAHWKASKVLDLNFFRDLYESIDGAYESVEEECQFLHFKSDFSRLRDVLEMDQKRALNLEGETPWYVGWKNCHPLVLQAIKKHFELPHFLPEDAEIPATNYIFLGYDQGAIMHLDYIPRLMWQGQILGSKTWTVAPTPECESVCGRFEFSVATGDIILIDTRLWYHGTYVENGSFSLTITSEYG